MTLTIVVFLILLCLFFLPQVPVTRGWGLGYYPSTGIAIILIVLACLYFSGHLHVSRHF